MADEDNDWDDGSEYRIEFTITRQRPGEDDFTEIGFGSSGAWNNVGSALYAVQSSVQNNQWETEAGMPDPHDYTSVWVDERDGHGWQLFERIEHTRKDGS